MAKTNFPDGLALNGQALVLGTASVSGKGAEAETGLSKVEGFVANVVDAIGTVSGDVSDGKITFSVKGDKLGKETKVAYLAWGAE